MSANGNTPGYGDRLEGLLVGTAVGDSVGLPAEGLSRRRGARLFPGPWRQRLVFGRGMLSDDSEHAFMVGQALLKYSDDPDRFERSLAWKLRWWLVALPAGVGLATLRACIKLWAGFPPRLSGVRSAGNGPAMRSPLIGAFFHENQEHIKDFVNRSTRLTHTDPKAMTGAVAVALVASLAIKSNPAAPPDVSEVIGLIAQLAPTDPDWKTIMARFGACFDEGRSVADFADSIGCRRGVSGYIYRTVPVAIYAWHRHYGDFRATLESVLNLGGDTDTVGAIVGALAGAVVGARGIPEEWERGILEWPRGIRFYRELARRLAECRKGQSPGPVRYIWPAVPIRNFCFMLVVLFHGFRRLLPPY